MLHKPVVDKLLVDDVLNCFVSAADGDGKVYVVSREEGQVDVEAVAKFGGAEEVAVQEVTVLLAGYVFN